MPEYEILNCPFCGEATISCMYFPSATRVRQKSTATFGNVKQKSRSSEQWIVQSGCSKCGKPQEKVEAELKKKDII